MSLDQTICLQMSATMFLLTMLSITIIRKRHLYRLIGKKLSRQTKPLKIAVTDSDSTSPNNAVMNANTQTWNFRLIWLISFIAGAIVLFNSKRHLIVYFPLSTEVEWKLIIWLFQRYCFAAGTSVMTFLTAIWVLHRTSLQGDNSVHKVPQKNIRQDALVFTSLVWTLIPLLDANMALFVRHSDFQIIKYHLCALGLIYAQLILLCYIPTLCYWSFSIATMQKLLKGIKSQEAMELLEQAQQNSLSDEDLVRLPYEERAELTKILIRINRLQAPRSTAIQIDKSEPADD